MITAAVSKKTTANLSFNRRPRVAILGEFSAGKSTLINLLTGGQALRTQVTATQMPAVWISEGSEAPMRVTLDGVEHPFDLDDPDAVSMADTSYIRLFMEAPVLEACDLIDTPGNSDPNMPDGTWQRAAAMADIAVWCSPATQAWRQSDFAAWQEMPEHVRANSVLLLTRADKITNEDDRARVLARVQHEAGDQFAKIHMASLLEFESIRDFLSDLISICTNVSAATLPQRTEQDETETEDALVLEDIIELENEVLAPASLAKVKRTDKPGQATTLWNQLTAKIASDDYEKLNAAFDTLLAKLDDDFDVLNTQLLIKKAG